ncbi:MAG: hypothetical protein RMM98_12810 [Acidobacteriota bacterium]|nr:hypothetical protein [Blastocatellia bacterium]MDW8240489.1 hypothetical protein [Acidobacteriota bacterium]
MSPSRFSRIHRLILTALILAALVSSGTYTRIAPSRSSLLPPPFTASALTAEQMAWLQHKQQRKERQSNRYDEPDQAQAFYLLKRLPVGMKTLPLERYFAAIRHIERMPRYSTALNLKLPSLEQRRWLSWPAAAQALGTWQPLGPGNVGGRTRALLIDPRNPDIMYAAGVAGGVWKTWDQGNHWTPLTDLLPNIAVCSLAMDPNDSNVIYAGTGEGYFNGDSVRGAGIFKTDDGGMQWFRLKGTDTADFHYVNALVVSPHDSRRLYAATRTGVWRSLDGGVSWMVVLPVNVTGGCLDLVIRTDQSSDYLFAACGTFAQGAVYRNIRAESDEAWEVVLNEDGMGRTALAIAPSNQNIIYAVSASIISGTYVNGLHAVFRSDQSGDPGSWTARVRNTDPNRLNTLLLSNPVYAVASLCGFGSDQFINQGWYDMAIAVDPVDPDRVWVGGVDLFRSDDGGKSWGQASHWWASPGSVRYVHADQHKLVFHPQYDGVSNRILYVANDGGIFRTTNARAPVATEPNAPCNPASGRVVWRGLNNNYAVTQFYHGVPMPDGKAYFGGTQDNGTLLGTDELGPNNWIEILGGDGGYCAVDPTNPNILYAETQRGDLRKSTNGGQSFFSITNGLNDGGLLFITPFTMDPNDPQRLWTGGQFLWRTTTGGNRWERASVNIRPSGTNRSVSAIAIAPTNPNRVMAGTRDGFIYRTDRALTASSNTVWPSVRPRAGYVSWVAFDPIDEMIAYATYSTFGGKHVWKTTDGGASWTSIDGEGETGLPDIPVHVILVDPRDTQRLYIGTDVGVFVSTDGGATWFVENTGFANVVTEALSLLERDGQTTLFAFTHGRGAWRVAVTR